MRNGWEPSRDNNKKKEHGKSSNPPTRKVSIIVEGKNQRRGLEKRGNSYEGRYLTWEGAQEE